MVPSLALKTMAREDPKVEDTIEFWVPRGRNGSLVAVNSDTSGGYYLNTVPATSLLTATDQSLSSV